MRSRSVRRAVPILPIFLVFAAASTGTVLASDVCGVSIVKTLTEAARHAEDHTEVTHKHTRATLERWQVWGNLYLAKHGHPYVPPKRPARHSADSDAQEARFKLECELPPVPVADLTTFALLPPEELLPPPETEIVPGPEGGGEIPHPPVITAENSYPSGPLVFGGAGPNATPLVPNAPPIPTVTPEPGSLVLLGTGLVAVLAFAKARRQSHMS